MPSTNQPYTQYTAFDFIRRPEVEGSILGAVTMFGVTPGVNQFNNYAKGRYNMPWSFAGWQPLVVSGVVGFGTCLTVKNLLGRNQKDASPFQQAWTSTAGGAVSGWALCPFENINTNYSESVRKTVQSIYTQRGIKGFFNGSVSMILREGGWGFTIMSAIPSISKNMRDAGYNRATADFFALFLSASAFGLISTPVNILRAKKQKMDHAIPEKAPSYLELVPTLFARNQVSTLVKTAMMRTATSGCAATIFYYSQQAYRGTFPQTSAYSR
jgi:hypothetical protein